MDVDPLDWPGVLDPSMMADAVVAARHRLADAARAGDWAKVVNILRDHIDGAGFKDIGLGPSQWRPGSPKWFTVLHQAAWHGAPESVVTELLDMGALRSLRDAKGRTAQDVAVERSQTNTLIDMLAPRTSLLDPERVDLLDRYLTEVIDGRIREGGLAKDYPDQDPHRVFRYPPVGVLHECPGGSVWFPIPGMYGGFHITLRQGYVESSSWCRVAGGSGQLHVITHEGVVLADEGFV